MLGILLLVFLLHLQPTHPVLLRSSKPSFRSNFPIITPFFVQSVAQEPLARLAVGILVRAERVAVGLVHRDHPPAQGQPQHNSALIVEGTGEENEAAAARAHSHDCIDWFN